MKHLHLWDGGLWNLSTPITVWNMLLIETVSEILGRSDTVTQTGKWHTSVHTYWTACSKLGSKPYTHPHTTPRTRHPHAFLWHWTPSLPNTLTHWQGRGGEEPHRKGQEERKERSWKVAETKEREGQGSWWGKGGKEKEEEEGREGKRAAEEGEVKETRVQGGMRAVTLLRFLLQYSSGQMLIQGNPGVRVLFLRHCLFP